MKRFRKWLFRQTWFQNWYFGLLDEVSIAAWRFPVPEGAKVKYVDAYGSWEPKDGTIVGHRFDPDMGANKRRAYYAVSGYILDGSEKAVTYIPAEFVKPTWPMLKAYLTEAWMEKGRPA